MSAHAHVYQRADDRWAFRIIAGNGEVVATDGGQGYENKTDAERTGRRLAAGWEADMKQQTTTMYGVARKDTVLDDQLYASFADARAKFARTEDAMRVAGLEPDVRLVQVDATTTYSRPKNAEAPEVDAAPVTIPSMGEGIVPDAAGVWGGSDQPATEQPEGVGGIPPQDGEGGPSDQGGSTADTTGGGVDTATDTTTTEGATSDGNS